jgi:DNA-binding MarR family transcriptional regulator
MARPPKLRDEALTAALTAHPEATAAEVAGVLGVGQSTTAKRLAALEATGAVHRIPGGRVAGVQAPDHWSVVVRGLPVVAPPEHADPEGIASEPTPAEPAAEGPAIEDRTSEDQAGRLGRGQLGTLVHDYLAARPGESFGPAGLGKALGRSQGAVSNALSAMAERGEVVLVADKPRRYRIAS